MLIFYDEGCVRNERHTHHISRSEWFCKRKFDISFTTTTIIITAKAAAAERH